MLVLEKREIATVKQLKAALQGAIRLELATLPPYLTALYSIMPGANRETAAIIRSVAVEEMLHLCIACNILNAIGGRPAITAPGAVPTYPGPLPMGIGTEEGQPFIVHLKKASVALIRDTFMVIEEPERPLRFPSLPVREGTPDFHTIGEFYRAIEDAIRAFGNGIFTGDPKRQVTGWFPSGELFPVRGVKTASRGIRVIIEQGEGTKLQPTDPQGQYAHYYRFSEIVEGRRLVRNPRVPQGYSYSGAPIRLEPDGVFPMVDDPTLVKLPPNTVVARYADRFDETYSCLLNAIQLAVDGDPKHLDVAIGVMYTLRIDAWQLISTPIPNEKVNAGPRWRYLGVTAKT